MGKKCTKRLVLVGKVVIDNEVADTWLAFTAGGENVRKVAVAGDVRGTQGWRIG